MAGKLRNLGFSLGQRGNKHLASPSEGRGLNRASIGKKDLLPETDLTGSTEIWNVVWLETENEVIDSKMRF